MLLGTCAMMVHLAKSRLARSWHMAAAWNTASSTAILICRKGALNNSCVFVRHVGSCGPRAGGVKPGSAAWDLPRRASHPVGLSPASPQSKITEEQLREATSLVAAAVAVPAALKQHWAPSADASSNHPLATWITARSFSSTGRSYGNAAASA